MKKILMFCIKILPLITLYKGITSGSDKFGPMLNIGKVAFTQYEVVQMAKMVGKDYSSSRGELIHPDDFPSFIIQNYHNQYSDLVREMMADNDKNISYDLWGNQFKLILSEETSEVLVGSAGKDKTWDSTDDIKLGFKIGSKNMKNLIQGSSDDQQDQPQFDRNGFDQEGYDHQGFDQDGLNRDGLDLNGFDRDGFNQDGYDREGFDNQGYDQDGNIKDEEESY